MCTWWWDKHPSITGLAQVAKKAKLEWKARHYEEAGMVMASE